MSDFSVEKDIYAKTRGVSKKAVITLAALTLVFYAIVTVFSIIFYADVYATRGENGNGLGVAVVLVLLLTYGSILNLASMGCAIAGVCVSKAKVKDGLSKLWTLFFSIMIALPVITEIVFFILLSAITG